MRLILEKPAVSVFDTGAFEDEVLYQNCYRAVCEERRKKVDFFRFMNDKRLSLAAGYLFEQGLRERGVTDWSLRYGEFEKPYLKDTDNLFFSLSHSGNYAVCVFFDREIGIDIEQIAQVDAGLIRHVCTDSEYHYLMDISEKGRQEEFCRLWTAKESYMKLLGVGLSLPPEQLEVSFGKKLAIRHKGNVLPVLFQEYPIDGYKMTVCYHT